MANKEPCSPNLALSSKPQVERKSTRLLAPESRPELPAVLSERTLLGPPLRNAAAHALRLLKVQRTERCRRVIAPVRLGCTRHRRLRHARETPHVHVPWTCPSAWDGTMRHGSRIASRRRRGRKRRRKRRRRRLRALLAATLARRGAGRRCRRRHLEIAQHVDGRRAHVFGESGLIPFSLSRSRRS